MWKSTGAKNRKPRKLTRDEQERVQDSMQLMQSARESLEAVDSDAVPGRQEIDDCLKLAGKSLREALRSN
jgi:hypothetical protein